MSKPNSFSNFLINFLNLRQIEGYFSLLLSAIGYLPVTTVPTKSFVQSHVFWELLLLFLSYTFVGYLAPVLICRRLRRVEEEGFTYYIGDGKYIGRGVNAMIIDVIIPFVAVTEETSYSEIYELRNKIESRLIRFEKLRKYMLLIIVGYLFGILDYLASYYKSNFYSRDYLFIISFSFLFLILFVGSIVYAMYYNIKYDKRKNDFAFHIKKTTLKTVHSDNVSVKILSHLLPLILSFSLIPSLAFALFEPSQFSYLIFLEKYVVEVILLSIIAFLSYNIFVALGLIYEEFLASFAQYLFISAIPQLFLLPELKYPSLNSTYIVILSSFTLIAYITAVLSTNKKKRALIAWLIIAFISLLASMIISLLYSFSLV
ncbi:hypothetical protein [Saccharolobus shibatae]|uniref:Uncharacterized protein n=1 Tax=Saccharolobus shibatae TaxID=2286 RepID=A0A8F5BVW2_9CREN|nr:hypothetical protein [Saccharolobus shibatae]QXJ32289.1 hypothetical protein J5U21_01940 [Saccharolobus shibatae]QXJ35324.1 hypothetical protein J5U22_01871 [Saccharolobus shibatae]